MSERKLHESLENQQSQAGIVISKEDHEDHHFQLSEMKQDMDNVSLAENQEYLVNEQGTNQEVTPAGEPTSQSIVVSCKTSEMPRNTDAWCSSMGDSENQDLVPGLEGELKVNDEDCCSPPPEQDKHRDDIDCLWQVEGLEGREGE